MYDAFKNSVLGTPTGVVLYGPPRTRRGRLANAIRRLLGRNERLVPYAQFDNVIDWNADTVKVTLRWDASGTFAIDEDLECLCDPSFPHLKADHE